MNNVPFTLSQVRPIRDAMTVSRPSGLGYGVPVTWFSLGAGTSITPEYYDCTTLYLGGETFLNPAFSTSTTSYQVPETLYYYAAA